MEIPWIRRSDSEAWEAMRSLTPAEFGDVRAKLRARGLEGTPAYAAWLRAEVTKAALRKQAALAAEAAAAEAALDGHRMASFVRAA